MSLSQKARSRREIEGEAKAALRRGDGGRGLTRRKGGLWPPGAGDPAIAAASSGEKPGRGGRSPGRGPHHAQSLPSKEEEPGGLGPQLG